MWIVLDFWEALLDARLTTLRKSMRGAVQKEDYLGAARLRDQIRNIERRRGKMESAVPARQSRS
jgi:protein-arginine kinase activator protein McsA